MVQISEIKRIMIMVMIIMMMLFFLLFWLVKHVYNYTKIAKVHFFNLVIHPY